MIVEAVAFSYKMNARGCIFLTVSITLLNFADYCIAHNSEHIIVPHVYLTSLDVVLFSTFNTQGQPSIVCPNVTLSDFPQSPQLKFFAEPHSRRLFGVGRVLSCEFRTKDSRLSEYFIERKQR